MSVDLLRIRINEGIGSENKTESARFRHLNTALNNLIKLEVIRPDLIQLALGDDLKNTLSKYKVILGQQGKSDLKSPLTRVRRLAEFYAQIYGIDEGGLAFHELLQVAVKRKYGDDLYVGEITPKNQNLILKDKITYRHVAKQIIIAACNSDPKLWVSVDLSKPATLGSASKVVRDYITGESIPGERVEDDRIFFIERFLHLSKNSLLSKIKRRVDHKCLGKKVSEKSISHTNKRVYVHKQLNIKLLRIYEEYSAFKISNTQPEIKNISDEMRQSKYFEMRNKVKENNKRASRWTMNAKGKCGSKEGFRSQLLFFQDYCINYLNIDFEEVGSEHLTNPEFLYDMVMKMSQDNSGGTSAARLLNWVYRGCQKQGYLRMCGDLGGRDLSEFFDDLEYIYEEYSEWHDLILRGVSENGKGSQKGKKNIAFLLKLPSGQRRQEFHKASKFLMTRAEKFQLEAESKIEFAKKSSAPVKADKYYRSAASYIKRALNYSAAALVGEISFSNCPRAANWTMLKYYASSSAKDGSFASITYLRQKNRFNLYIPLYGSSLIESGLNSRYIKNADAENAVDIDLDLPEGLTPLIKKYLSIRADFIKMELVRFSGVEKEDVEMFFPWRFVRASAESNSTEQLLNSMFIYDASKFSDNFKHLYYLAFLNVMPSEKQHGINLHAMRHLVASTHVDDCPGDYLGAAAKLNDDVEQIIKTYGDKDRSKAMRGASNAPYIFEDWG